MTVSEIARCFPHCPNVAIELVEAAEYADDALRNRADDAQRADALQALLHAQRLIAALVRAVRVEGAAS